MLRIAVTGSPIEVGRFILAMITGGKPTARSNFDGTVLKMRAHSPALRVIADAW